MVEAVALAKKEGIKVGTMRLIVVWPFPEKRIQELAIEGKALVMAEMNYGQVYYELDRCAKGLVPVLLAGHGGGMVHNPEDIYHAIKEAYK